MTSATYNKEKIIPEKDYLSLWDIAHRLANVEQNTSDPEAPPTAVVDILQSMLIAQQRSELAVVTVYGIQLKDDRYLPSWIYLNPNNEETWRYGKDHAQELYNEFITKKTERLHKHIDHHNNILIGSAPYSKKYLDKINTDKTDFAEWTLRKRLPFPNFWFHDDEIENTLLELELKVLVDDECTRLERRGICPLRNSIAQETTPNHSPDITTEQTPTKYKKDEIDVFWGTLNNQQRARILCREIATILWKNDPNLGIEDIKKNEVFLKYGGARYFSSKNTTRDWIKDLDPRPPSERVGRPRNKP